MNLPAMIPVISSDIESIGYDEQSQNVYVRFLSGTLYLYIGVPEHEFQNLLQASSHGSYLHCNFKNVYAYERLE